jgi:chloride channel, nucleotide-sensitive, 1A
MAGVSIPYPSISLHAIQTLPTAPNESSEQGVYMQLLSSVEETAEDLEPESVSVTIIPNASPPSAAPTSAPDPDLNSEDKPQPLPVQALFNALSDCANLHPDPIEDEEDGGMGSTLIRSGLALPGDSSGGLPPPMPGSGGWITAENMHEFVDQDGNWIDEDDNNVVEQGSDPLGPGAGTVRSREESHEDEGENGEDDTKWQRTY